MSKWIDQGSFYEHNVPQGDPEWLRARIGRITTSIIGALVGHSNLKTPQQAGLIIAGKVVETFDEEHQEFVEHGKRTEPIARDWFQKSNNFNIIERGLCVPKFDLLLGASVDGDVIDADMIIEIKSPQKIYSGIKLYLENCEIGWKPPKNYIGHILKTHYDQMQLGMKVLNRKYANYIVYCTFSGDCFVQKVLFDEKYWNEFLYPTAKRNYELYVLPHLDKTEMIDIE